MREIFRLIKKKQKSYVIRIITDVSDFLQGMVHLKAIQCLREGGGKVQLKQTVFLSENVRLVVSGEIGKKGTRLHTERILKLRS